MEYANANGASVISKLVGGPDYSQALKDAIDASPALVVCACINNAPYNIDINASYPASYTSANIISVAATDQNDQSVIFSHYGPVSVDLAAPGTNIWKYHQSGWNLRSNEWNIHGNTSCFREAALAKAVNPTLNSLQIKNIILATVDQKTSLSGKVASGGRLNAYKAVLSSNPPVRRFHRDTEATGQDRSSWYSRIIHRIFQLHGSGRLGTEHF